MGRARQAQSYLVFLRRLDLALDIRGEIVGLHGALTDVSSQSALELDWGDILDDAGEAACADIVATI